MAEDEERLTSWWCWSPQSSCLFLDQTVGWWCQGGGCRWRCPDGWDEGKKSITRYYIRPMSPSLVVFHLWSQLIEEIQGQTGNVRLRVNQQQSYLADLTFDLQHILEHQLSKNGHSCLPHWRLFITQPEKRRGSAVWLISEGGSKWRVFSCCLWTVAIVFFWLWREKMVTE